MEPGTRRRFHAQPFPLLEKEILSRLTNTYLWLAFPYPGAMDTEKAPLLSRSFSARSEIVASADISESPFGDELSFGKYNTTGYERSI